jgi:hypothetical protein
MSSYTNDKTMGYRHDEPGTDFTLLVVTTSFMTAVMRPGQSYDLYVYRFYVAASKVLQIPRKWTGLTRRLAQITAYILGL